MSIDLTTEPGDAAAWHALVEAALKGRSPDSLRSRTEDGLILEPLYGEGTGAPVGRPGGRPWTIVQRVDHPTVSAANRQAFDDLENGATGLAIVTPAAPTRYGAGLAIGSRDDLALVLDGVVLDAIPLRLEAGGAGRAAAALLASHLDSQGIDPAIVEVHFGLDPLGAFGSSGRLSAAWPHVALRLADTVQWIIQAGFHGTVVTADGRPWHDAGATDAQELALILANFAEVMRAFDGCCDDLGPAVDRIGVAVSADQDQFATIAKLRALRTLVATLREAASLSGTAVHVHAQTAWRMMTKHDPYTNMLRCTIAAFAAAAGGADSLTVLPFTQAAGTPDGFARRIARNTQTILTEESNLFRVADPGAGAGAIEALSADLAGAAWEIFRSIERAGGLAAAIVDGTVASLIRPAREERLRRVAKRTLPIVGTSRFALLAEPPAPVDTAEVQPLAPPVGIVIPSPEEGKGDGFSVIVAAAAAGVTVADLGSANLSAEAISAEPLPPHRVSEAFERLRAAAAAARENGQPAQILLVALGPLTDHQARLQWAAGLFEAGGIEPVRCGPDATPAMVAGRAASGTIALACLCGTDAAYAEQGAAVAAALASAGAVRIYVAGRRPAAAEALEAAGAGLFVHEGIDILALLADAHAALAIAPADAAA